MFAPAALGVTEDPATGSAVGPLAIHLARHGRIGFGGPLCIIARHHPAASRHSAGQPGRRGRAEPYPRNATAPVRVSPEVTGSVPALGALGTGTACIWRQHPSRAGARPWLRGYGFPGAVLSRDQETQLAAWKFGVLNLGPKRSSDRLPGRPIRRGGGTRPGSVSLMLRQPARPRYRRCPRKPARLRLRARRAHKRRSAARPGRLPRPLPGPRAALPMLAAAPG
jgi:hypothetical protein